MLIITISTSTSATRMDGFREIRVTFVILMCRVIRLSSLVQNRVGHNFKKYRDSLFSYSVQEHSDCQNGCYACYRLIEQALRKIRVCATAAPPRPAARPVHPLALACRAFRFSSG